MKLADVSRARVAALGCTGAFALAALVSACGGGSSSQAQPTAQGSGSSAGAETVSVQPIDGVGKVLVDSKGFALYTPEQEAGGKIVCTGPCTQFWVPLTVPGADSASATGSDLSGKLGVEARPGGERQVTFDGAPLYRFVEDSAPGKVSGDAFSDSFGGQGFDWHVVTIDDVAPGSSGTGGSGSGMGY